MDDYETGALLRVIQEMQQDQQLGTTREETDAERASDKNTRLLETIQKSNTASSNSTFFEGGSLKSMLDEILQCNIALVKANQELRKEVSVLTMERKILLDKLLQIDLIPPAGYEQFGLPAQSTIESIQSGGLPSDHTEQQLLSKKRSSADLSNVRTETTYISTTALADPGYNNALTAGLQQHYETSASRHPSAQSEAQEKSKEGQRQQLSAGPAVSSSAKDGKSVSKKMATTQPLAPSHAQVSRNNAKRGSRSALGSPSISQSPLSALASPMPTTMSPRRPGSLKRKATLKRLREEEATPYAPPECDEDGKPTLPQIIGLYTLVHLGAIVTDRPAFHTDRYIYPIGYTIERPYPSMVDPETDTTMTATILDGGDAPIFSLTAADMPDAPLTGGSPSTPWTAAVKLVCQIRGRRAPKSTAGPDLYGLKNSTIAKLIQDLPGADQLGDYVWQNFQDATERTDKRRNTQKSSLGQLTALAKGSKSKKSLSALRPTSSASTTPSGSQTQQQQAPSSPAVTPAKLRAKILRSTGAKDDAFESAGQTVAYCARFGMSKADVSHMSDIAVKMESPEESRKDSHEDSREENSEENHEGSSDENPEESSEESAESSIEERPEESLEEDQFSDSTTDE